MTLKVLFWHDDVRSIVTQEVEIKKLKDFRKIHTEGQEDIITLKEKVTQRVMGAMHINSGDLPGKVKTWIYSMCTEHTWWLDPKEFTGKLAIPVDCSSLPNSDHCQRTKRVKGLKNPPLR